MKLIVAGLLLGGLAQASNTVQMTLEAPRVTLARQAVPFQLVVRNVGTAPQ